MIIMNILLLLMILLMRFNRKRTQIINGTNNFTDEKKIIY